MLTLFRTKKVLIWLLLVLAGILIFGIFILQNRLKSDIRQAEVDVSSRVMFYSMLLKDRLQAKDFQRARELVEELGENMPDIIELDLVTDNGYQLAKYKRSIRTEHNISKKTDIDYSYSSRASFSLKISIDHLYLKNIEMQESFLFGYLLITLVLVYLSRTNARIFSQKQALHHENQRRITAENELVQHRDHLQEMVLERTSELEKARDQALHLSQVKNEFIATMSHELRTPLTSIKGAIELLSGKNDLDETGREKLLAIANKNTDRLLHLINELLDVQKIESNFIEFKYSLIDVLDVVRQSMELNRTYAYERHVDMAFQHEEVPHVWCDANRLIQVLSNLLSNAVKFSPRDGTVLVNISMVNAVVRIEVQDHGKGVAREFEPCLFKKFSQHDASTTRAEAGAGLGLAISKSLIERMGGKIGYSRNDSGGASFFVELPSAEQ